jgi:TPR repeat protein
MAGKTKRSWIGRTILAAIMPMVAQAQTVQDGLAAFEQGNYAHALELLLPLAEKGDAEAQCQMGRLYSRGGDGIPQNSPSRIIPAV